MIIEVSHPTGIIDGLVRLDGSKSISNRALIIQKLSGQDFTIEGLSTSHDTTTLQQMLTQSGQVLDSGHAGTSFRFTTAYAAIGGEKKILTGSDRMKQRPIGPLVEALNSIGADITYLEKDGYPPLNVGPFRESSYQRKVEIRADVSSQYLSALLMIAPKLPEGLEIHLIGELVSRPYLEMTLRMMSDFGVKYNWEGQVIRIESQAYQAHDYIVEADWSAASYYYGLAAMAKKTDLRLVGLQKSSVQGDQQMTKFGEEVGISSIFKDDIWHLKSDDKKADISPSHSIDLDFKTCPDIAQTWAVMAAGNGAKTRMTGLQTLVIKETNRIEALSQELQKVGCDFTVTKDTEHLPLARQAYEVTGALNFSSVPKFRTYEDHRMAMAFAPLALRHPIQIENPDVVKKSYPNFWTDFKKLGFRIKSL